jgi:hydroxyacylglutathione hydrolase
MYVEQLYTGCLAEAAYYIESEGEAAVIDPLRETTPYIELAKKRNARIKYVFETHFHADFVSGHLDLAAETGAKIIYGPEANTTFKVYNAKDGEEFQLGKLKIKTLHTPGHTPESTCYLLFDTDNKPYSVFTGDTLFVGDVGRPDLLDGVLTKEELAGSLYESLNKKIKTLPDNVIVYPGHGAGSSCGKNIGKESFSTIGAQKKTNYALQDLSKEEFIRQVTDGIAPPPQYFFRDAEINKTGYQPLKSVMENSKKGLSLPELHTAKQKGAIIIDTRNPDDFESGYIKDSLNIGLNGQYAIWAATLLDISQAIVLVTDLGKEEESILRLARVGFENVKGYLKGGISTWINAGLPLEEVESIKAEEVKQKMNEGYSVIDVRKPGEYEDAHVCGAKHFSLAELEKNISSLERSEKYVIHCAGGYRSMIAASILKKEGFENLLNVYGGFGKIKETDLPVEQGTMQCSG